MVQKTQRAKGILMGKVSLIFPAIQFPEKCHEFHVALIFKNTNGLIQHMSIVCIYFQLYLEDIIY